MLQKDSGELLLVADHCLDVRLISKYAKYDYKVLGLVTMQFLGVSRCLIESFLINLNTKLIFVRHVLCGWWRWRYVIWMICWSDGFYQQQQLVSF